MPHPDTPARQYSHAWHQQQETLERAWLDTWAHLHLTPATRPERAPQAPARALTPTGSH